ncbi:cell division protein ZipA [Halopseudomonas bauzanensis]|uniref:Cell division protein ZipA n=1 Tax=Halopseudomonas bauzanensis TaxID=653930 RepID=A0A1I4NJP6_9GAMM|nr:cell division protein ZipA [Halopseudomonas bauzanensis]SES20602.1 cell division protein ZipA [Halopseudomonas bauzanensis]SFM15383.1 cell division protein ZipA [Halopseudomonas bauzanensis]
MDFGLREWLIIIGLLVIAGILFDGWRRMGGRSRIRFKLERDFKDLPEGAAGDELLGPARVIARGEREEPTFGDDQVTADTIDSLEVDEMRQPEQAGLDLDEPERAPEPAPRAQSSRTPRPRREPIAESEPVTAQATQAPASPASEPVAPEEVLVILVVARSEEGFPGAAMMQSIMESGLRYGDMNIFHRHESMTGNGDVLFSMANALKPGTFDLDELEHNHVRAVTFFMGLPGPRHPKQALDLMIASARKLSQELGGDLKDENRSVLTAQTIEHYRQRIAEFERKRFGLRR